MSTRSGRGSWAAGWPSRSGRWSWRATTRTPCSGCGPRGASGRPSGGAAGEPAGSTGRRWQPLLGRRDHPARHEAARPRLDQRDEPVPALVEQPADVGVKEVPAPGYGAEHREDFRLARRAVLDEVPRRRGRRRLGRRWWGSLGGWLVVHPATVAAGRADPKSPPVGVPAGTPVPALPSSAVRPSSPDGAGHPPPHPGATRSRHPASQPPSRQRV